MSNLQVLRIQITTIEGSIAVEKEKEWTVLANLGQAVHDSGGGDDLAETFGDAVVKASEEIRALEDSLRKLFAAEERGAAISDENKALNVELRNLKNKAQDNFDELARRAWDYWKSGRSAVGLGEALEELIAAEERLNTVQTAVSRNERLNENLGGSILSKGRALFLSGRYRTASSSMERLWGTAGAKIYGAVDMDEFKGTAVEAVAEILKAIDIRKQEIQDRLLHLITEKTNIDADVEKMPGKGSIRRRMAWVEKALRGGRLVLEEAFRGLGEAWLDAGEGEPLSPEVEKHREEWDKVRERVSMLESEKHALEAHCEYREAESAWEKQSVRVQNLDAKAKKLQFQLKEAKKELSALDKSRNKLKESLPPLPRTVDDA